MNKILHTFCQDTYSEFERDLISNWAVGPRSISGFSSLLKGIHRRQLALACAATIVGIRASRNEYAGELVQTSHSSIILAVKGLENCACVLVRQTIELTLKHIYFATHPVEHAWSATRDNYKEVSFQSLIEYVKRTDEYQQFSSGNTCLLCVPIEDNFAVLSRYVHMQSKRFMSYRKIGTASKINGDILQGLDRVTAVLWPALTALLVVFFRDRFIHAQEIEKNLIGSVFARETKISLAHYLRNAQVD